MIKTVLGFLCDSKFVARLQTDLLLDGPAAVGFDHGVYFGHEADGFAEGNDDFVVMGDVLG